MPSDESENQTLHPLFKCPSCYRFVVMEDSEPTVICSCGSEMKHHRMTPKEPFGSERLEGIVVIDD